MITKICGHLIKNFNNFFADIINFIQFLKKNKSKICFFNENTNTFKYLEFFIKKKIHRQKIVLFSFEKLHFDHKNCIKIVLLTNFFREIFFLTLKFKYLYTTTTNLNFSIFKKTIIGKTKYIYIQHSPVSLLRAYDKDAFISFDAIQVINKFQYDEVEIINNYKKLKIKKIKTKYQFLNQHKKYSVDKIDVLLAPTWKTNFYSLNYHVILLQYFKKNKISYSFRPHPQSIKNKEFDLNSLSKTFDIDTSSDLNLTNYKNLITDWSGIFLEFALVNKVKPYLIKIDKKILNDKYKSDNSSIEDFAKERIANSISINELDSFDYLKFKFEDTKDKILIDSFKHEFFY